ncbi:PH domain-containing protein, partial [Parafrankia sp. FMc2]|uniref:PH domain-containing protein n=1 Tax=Parafrankia sp. FMc2 TaxID=3233196 RepID=UPI0034D44B1E
KITPTHTPARIKSINNPAHTGPGPHGEQNLWETTSQTLAGVASGGRAAGRYRLTNIRLYVTEGITTTKTEQYELGRLFDIDIRQTLVQRARSVGDVIVHVRRGWGQETVILQSVSDPARVRDMLNQLSAQARQPPRAW